MQIKKLPGFKQSLKKISTWGHALYYVFREVQINPSITPAFLEWPNSRTLIPFHPGKDGEQAEP